MVACVHATIAPLQQSTELLGQVVRRLNADASKDLFRVLAELDLSFTQVKALVMLEDGGVLSVGDLAASLSLSPAAASRAVEGLVRRGMVERRECAEDRRSRLLELRPDGREVLRAVAEARLARLEAFLAGVPEAQLAALNAALLPIVEGLRRP